jgi:transposase-like protein
MPPSTCPSCASDDIGFKPKKSLWKCDNCEHEFNFTESESRRLYPDGHMVVTQTGGQVCFLQLYSGNEPISLDAST